MAHNDKRINKALSAITMQEKRMLKQGYNRQVVNNFKKRQSNFVMHAVMPPFIGVNKLNTATQMLTAAMCNSNEFTTQDIEAFIGYLDKQVYQVFKDPRRTEADRLYAFMRITALAYMVETLLEIMVERASLVLSDTFMSTMKSHNAAINQFIAEVNDRRQRVDKWALSGNNYRQIDEFRDMAVGLLKNVYIDEWYTAYTAVYYRFIAIRMGAEVKEFV